LAEANSIENGCAPPPNHRYGVVHDTGGDAEKNDEHFDGSTAQWG
jgi:hypothetical protein